MPYRLFHMPGVLRQTLRYVNQIRECGFCHSRMVTKEEKAREHVARHVYGPEAIYHYALTDNVVMFPEESDLSKTLGVKARARIKRAASRGKRPN